MQTPQESVLTTPNGYDFGPEDAAGAGVGHIPLNGSNGDGDRSDSGSGRLPDDQPPDSSGPVVPTSIAEPQTAAEARALPEGALYRHPRTGGLMRR
jgi:hypothetical protein